MYIKDQPFCMRQVFSHLSGYPGRVFRMPRKSIPHIWKESFQILEQRDGKYRDKLKTIGKPLASSDARGFPRSGRGTRTLDLRIMNPTL